MAALVAAIHAFCFWTTEKTWMAATSAAMTTLERKRFYAAQPRTLSVNTTSATTTHYPAATVAEAIESHTLAVIVDNEPGVLARVIGLFSGRGYNIESLTVSETEHEKHLSRITIVTRGTPMVIEQIKNQLDRMVPIHRVVDMTIAGPAIERELAMVKVRGTGASRAAAMRLAEEFQARAIDDTAESFVFEITGGSETIDQFINLMLPLGLVEVSRTGIVAIARGPEGM